MLIRPINSLIKEQQVQPDEMTFLGLVEDNNDPKKLGRLKVRIEPYSEMTTDQLPWAAPILGSHGNSSLAGGINVPEIGSQVRVSFPSKDLNAPYYSGAELNEINKTNFFDEDYPNVYGYKDSVGTYVAVNKEKGFAVFNHSSGTHIQVAPDGSFKIGLVGGASFIFTSDKSFSLNIGTLNISGTPDGTLDISANSEINIDAATVNIKGDLEVTKGNLEPKSGASGSFITNGSYVEVTNGIITAIK